MVKENPAQDLWGKSVNRMWTRRTNQEVRDCDIVTVIKSQRLRWFGHVERMLEDRLPKMARRGTIDGRRRRRRQRSRWWSEVRRDFEQARISRWREKAANRGEWRRTVNQAMGLLGLSC